MTNTLLVARNDLARLVRQRQTLVWAVLMPPLFFWFIGSVTSGAADAGLDRPLAVLDVPSWDGVLTDVLRDRLERAGFHVHVEGRDDGLDAGGPGDADLVIHAPMRLSAAVLDDGEAADLQIETTRPEPEARGLELRVRTVALALATDVVRLERARTRPTAEAFAALADDRPVRLAVGEAANAAPRGFGQAVPGILVMFTMLVLLTTGTSQIVGDRERGLLRRLASTPLRRSSIVAGKWLAVLGLALGQLAIGLGFGVALFGLDLGTSWPAVLGVLFAWAVFTASLAVLVATLARTSAQASAAGFVVTMLLAALGGCWWPIEIAPDFMQALARVLPSRWAMDAFHQLVTYGLGAESVLPQVAGLGAAALALALVASRAFRFD